MTPWIKTRRHKSGAAQLYTSWKKNFEGPNGKARWGRLYPGLRLVRASGCHSGHEADLSV